MADKHIASSGKRTETPRTENPLPSRRTPGGKGQTQKQTQKQTQPETPVPRVASKPVDRFGSDAPVPSRLPREETSSANGITPSTENSTHSDSTEISTHSGSEELSFGEMVRKRRADRGGPQSEPAQDAEKKLDFFEFIRTESPLKSKSKGSRETLQLKKISLPAPWGRLRRSTMASDRAHGAQPEADPEWGTLTPKAGRSADPQAGKPNVRGHARQVSAHAGPEGRAERSGAPEATPRSPRSRSLLEFTKGDRERWLMQAKGVASYGALFEFQIEMVKMAMAVEREDFNVRPEGKVFTFGRDDKGCVFNGQAVENVYRPIAESSLVALQNSAIAQEVDRQLSRLREAYPALRQSHIQAVEDMARPVPSARQTGRAHGPAHGPDEQALAAYIAPVLLLVRGSSDSVETSRLPPGMLRLAYALDYEVAILCLGKKAIDFAQFMRLRKNMLISYLFTQGVSKFLIGQPGQHDDAIALFSSALNEELNRNSDAFIESVLLASLEKFPEPMKRNAYALKGQAGMAASATTFAFHSSPQDIALRPLEFGNVKKLDKQLAQLPARAMKKGIDLFVRELEKRDLPAAFLSFFEEAMKGLKEDALEFHSFSTYCLDTVKAYWERHEKQGVAASRRQVEALLALEREWRAQLA